MASATLTISDDIKPEIKSFPWINWSEVAKEELIKQEERLKAWREVEKILEKSKLNQKQADKLSDDINWSLAKRYEKLLKKRK